MSDEFDDKLLTIKFLLPVVKWAKTVIIPGFEGLSLYDFWELYAVGILKGTFATRASAIAYSFFMALFPFFLFILNLIPYVPIDGFQTELLSFIDRLLPPQTQDFFEPILLDIAANPRAGLLSFTLVFAIFLMANGVNAIFTGFEYSFHTVVKRDLFKQYVVALGVSIMLALLLLIVVIGILYFQFYLQELFSMEELKNRDKAADTSSLTLISQLGSFLGLLILIYGVVANLYYFGTKEGKHWNFFSIGATVTTFLFILTTYLFGLYINNFSTYNELYGSLGALLILMVYIWLNSNLLLLGFELNAAMYRLKRRRDSKKSLSKQNEATENNLK
ncbi:YihY/virulence factor BrkB family protein [Leeuwenhoekiella parthenopeia]|uniref:YihY/virulence factor BrkB family protein n=1 Tax=Leeuwenhoekiella parthenopeia TaxID=2890320 RepID=A0ABS8GMF3_9FLAO|nr:YihY/virulence factor BrkB family protein [Leeuwenhoekiella parthenopeia]MCC4211089.1 YihY/virulence factor BrkB family protein [Leeuwenhoekiella parthenopeia]